MPTYCPICEVEHADLWFPSRFWISLGILLLSIFVWFVVRQEQRAAEFRQDKFTECVRIYGDPDASVCQKWRSEW